MNPTKNRRSREWKAITIEEIEKRFHTDFFQDIKSLVLYCKNKKMDWTIDIQKQNKFIMIFFVSEDVSWIYEIEKRKKSILSTDISRAGRSTLLTKENE